MNTITSGFSDPYLNYQLYEAALELESSEQHTLHLPRTIYRGEVKEGQPHGHGTKNWRNGDYFIGEFDEDFPVQGYGQSTLSSGRAFVGDFLDGKAEGRGILTTVNGVVIEGQFENGYAQGYAVMTELNGDRFEGEFIQGKIWYGFVRMTHPDGSIYTGEYSNECYHGHGKLVRANGDYEKGEFVDGLFIKGFVKKTYPFGSFYEGQFENGMCHGFGTYFTVPDPMLSQSGLWEYGVFKGGAVTL